MHSRATLVLQIVQMCPVRGWKLEISFPLNQSFDLMAVCFRAI